MWFHYRRGPRFAGFMMFPFMLLFWMLFASRGFSGIVFSMIMIFVIGSIVRLAMRSTSARAPSQPYYQPPQQQPSQPYYQPSQQQQAYYQPPLRNYDQGYERAPQAQQETSSVDADREKQYEQPEQYERPSAQYPQQMPPMQ